MGGERQKRHTRELTFLAIQTARPPLILRRALDEDLNHVPGRKAQVARGLRLVIIEGLGPLGYRGAHEPERFRLRWRRRRAFRFGGRAPRAARAVGAHHGRGGADAVQFGRERRVGRGRILGEIVRLPARGRVDGLAVFDSEPAAAVFRRYGRFLGAGRFEFDDREGFDLLFDRASFPFERGFDVEGEVKVPNVDALHTFVQGIEDVELHVVKRLEERSDELAF